MESQLAGLYSKEDVSRLYKSLEADLADAKSAMSQAQGSELDPETLTGYLKHLCSNTHILWLDRDLDGKQRLQKALFPHGLEYSRETGFGTPLTSPLFNLLGNVNRTENELASPR